MKIKHLILIMFLIFVFSFIIRYHGIDSSSFWLDEVLQTESASGDISTVWRTSSPDKPPLDYYLEWLFVRNNVNETTGRIHACIAGSAAVITLGMWAYFMGGNLLFFIVVMLTLSHPVLVSLSQESRAYSLMLFSQCMFFAVCWHYMKSKNRLQIYHSVFMGASLFLCLWSLYFTIPVCIANGLFFLLKGRQNLKKDHYIKDKEKSVTRLPLYILIVFLLLILLSAIPLYFRTKILLTRTFHSPFDFCGGSLIWIYFDIFAQGYKFPMFTKGAGNVIIFLAVAGWIGWGLRKEKSFAANFCGINFLAIFAGTFVFYKIINHWMEERYILTCLPFLILLCAMGVESIGYGLSKFISLLMKSGDSSMKLYYIFSIILAIMISAASLHFVFKNPVKRTDWRELAKRIKEEGTDKTIVIAGDYLDEVVLKHYFKRYDIKSKTTSTNYNVDVLKDILAKNEDAWIVVKAYSGREDYLKEMNKYPKEQPPLWLLDVNRKAPPEKIILKNRAIKNSALSEKNPVLTILPGEKECPYLGQGWTAPEIVGGRNARSIDGIKGEIYAVSETQGSALLSVSLLPFAPTKEPQMTIKVLINDKELQTLQVVDGFSNLSWEIPEGIFNKGLNRIFIVSNRAVMPGEIDPNNKDPRHISVWVESLRLEIK